MGDTSIYTFFIALNQLCRCSAGSGRKERLSRNLIVLITSRPYATTRVRYLCDGNTTPGLRNLILRCTCGVLRVSLDRFLIRPRTANQLYDWVQYDIRSCTGIFNCLEPVSAPLINGVGAQPVVSPDVTTTLTRTDWKRQELRMRTGLNAASIFMGY